MKTTLQLRAIGMSLLIALFSAGCDRKATGQNAPPSKEAEATPSGTKTPPLKETHPPALRSEMTLSSKAKKPLSELIREMQSLRTGDRAQEGHNLMKEFVAAWRPVGKRTPELETLLGRPDERRHDSLSYRFDTGYYGWRWVFTTSGDLITDVTIKLMN